MKWFKKKEQYVTRKDFEASNLDFLKRLYKLEYPFKFKIGDRVKVLRRYTGYYSESDAAFAKREKDVYLIVDRNVKLGHDYYNIYSLHLAPHELDDVLEDRLELARPPEIRTTSK